MADDGISIRLEGYKALADSLREMPVRIRRAMMRSFARIGGSVVQDARSAAPHKTGKLRSSIRLRVSERQDKTGVWMRVSVGQWYGALMEEGVNSIVDDFRVWKERKPWAAGRLGGKRKRWRVKQRTLFVAARPFFGPAWQRAASRFGAEAQDALTSAMEGH